MGVQVSSMRFWPLPRPLRISLYAAATAVLLWLSLAPVQDLPREAMFWDKAEHSLAYLVLAGLGLALFPGHPRLVAAFSLSVGLGVEVLQSLQGFGRQGDPRDMVANSLGVGAAFVLWATARRLRPRPA